MSNWMSVEQQFQRRAEAVPKLGLGLSVDVYSPDLYELMSRFEGLVSRPAYLEIFRATTTALHAVRQYLARLPLADGPPGSPVLAVHRTTT